MQGLEDFLKTHDGGDMLDIACGGGAFGRRLVDGCRSYKSVTGLDMNEGAREGFLSNVEGNNVTFVASPIADYLEGDHSYDTVSVSNALHHLAGVGTILRDLRAIVDEDGVVIIHEMYADGITPAQETQRDVHAMIARLHRVQGEFHRGAYTREEIRGFVARSGLVVQHLFEARNEDAPIEKGKDGFAGRLKGVLDQAYPDGAPAEVQAEVDDLMRRAVEIGVGRPPQWTLVCAYE